MIRLIQAAVTVALLALLWHLADGASALSLLAAADPRWIALALGALTLQTVLSALRWRLTAGRLGIALDRRTAIGEYYLSQIVNQTLPGSVLGDAGRAVRARRQAGLLASGQAVVFERLAGQAGLVAVFAAALAGTVAVPGGFDWPDALLWPVLGVAVAALAAMTVLRHLPGRAGRALATTGAAFRHAVWSPGLRLHQSALSLATALLNIAAFACCAAAIGAPLPPTAALALVPVILFTMLVPVTVSGWGLREGAAAALLPLAGATAAQGLAASVAFGLAVLASALPGLLAAASHLLPATRSPGP